MLNETWVEKVHIISSKQADGFIEGIIVNTRWAFSKL